MWTSAAIAEASLVAGAQLANIDVPRVVFGQALPVFLKLNFISVGTTPPARSNATSSLIAMIRSMGTGGAYSGYPAGPRLPTKGVPAMIRNQLSLEPWQGLAFTGALRQ